MGPNRHAKELLKAGKPGIRHSGSWHAPPVHNNHWVMGWYHLSISGQSGVHWLMDSVELSSCCPSSPLLSELSGCNMRQTFSIQCLPF
ncbi:unnamed protein product [Musa acuminata subsp. burmannicoides]